MRDVSKLRLLCSAFCRHYQTEAKFYIAEEPQSGPRLLVVVYATGGYDGKSDFTAGIPASWTDDDVLTFILRDRADMKYPVWEMAVRAYGKKLLDRSG